MSELARAFRRIFMVFLKWNILSNELIQNDNSKVNMIKCCQKSILMTEYFIDILLELSLTWNHL